MTDSNRPLRPDQDLTWENTNFEDANADSHIDDGDLPVLAEDVTDYD